VPLQKRRYKFYGARRREASITWIYCNLVLWSSAQLPD
jgi:hypothetical protein